MKNFLGRNYKIIITIGLIVLSAFMFLIILIKKPQVTSAEPVMNYKEMALINKNISFPFEQKIKISEDNLSYLDFFLADDSLSKFPFSVEITNQDGETVFEHFYEDYGSNIIRVDPKTKAGDEISLVIRCIECKNNVRFQVYSGEKDYLFSLKYSQKNNNWFFLYPIILFIFAFVLGFYCRKEKDEKISSK